MNQFKSIVDCFTISSWTLFSFPFQEADSSLSPGTNVDGQLEFKATEAAPQDGFKFWKNLRFVIRVYITFTIFFSIMSTFFFYMNFPYTSRRSWLVGFFLSIAWPLGYFQIFFSHEELSWLCGSIVGRNERNRREIDCTRIFVLILKDSFVFFSIY